MVPPIVPPQQNIIDFTEAWLCDFYFVDVCVEQDMEARYVK